MDNWQVKHEEIVELGKQENPAGYKEEAKRVSHPFRYDILDPAFLEIMAMIADYGAKKYGDYNWHKSRLEGDKSPINHIYKHLKSYRINEPYDHTELGTHRKLHLVAI